MKHQTLEQLQQSAVVHPDRKSPAMSRRARLKRWAELLERKPDRRLATFPGTEYQPPAARDAMCSAGSPISVAFEDPMLRAEGLRSDSYGEAKRFFELSDWELHGIICYCHHGPAIAAATAARFVRSAMVRSGQPGLFARFRNAIAGVI